VKPVNLLALVSQATKRSAEYCGKSKTMTKKIRKEHKVSSDKGSAEILSQ
jgi:hypothetical protein